MSISPINNNTDTKQHLILASTGGILWGGIKRYSIYKNVKSERDAFKKAQDNNFGLQDEKFDLIDEKLRLTDEAISLEKKKTGLLQKATELTKLGEDISEITKEIDSITIPENIELEAKNNVTRKRDAFIKIQTETFKTKIKNIKNGALSKTAIRVLGGAVVGLAVSYMITYFKNKN